MTALVAALAVAAVLGPGLVDRLARRSVRRRLRGLAPSGRAAHPRRGGTPPLPRTPGGGAGPTSALAPALGRIGAPLRRLAHRPVDPTADTWAGATALLAAAALVLLGPVPAVLVAAVTGAVPAVRARSRRRRAELAVRKALPDVVDLFRLAVGAGLSVHQAVDAVAARAPDPVGAALQEVRRRTALGERLGDALDGLTALGDPARPLVAALTGAARYGNPLGSTLERVGEDARMLRRRQAEERARKLPVQLLFPLVTCVLPAFGLLAVVPLLAGSLPALSDAP